MTRGRGLKQPNLYQRAGAGLVGDIARALLPAAVAGATAYGGPAAGIAAQVAGRPLVDYGDRQLDTLLRRNKNLAWLAAGGAPAAKGSGKKKPAAKKPAAKKPTKKRGSGALLASQSGGGVPAPFRRPKA